MFCVTQELRDRQVPTDESLVRTIRSLLLNTNDSLPTIPLSRPKPHVANVSNTMNASDREAREAEKEKGGETMPPAQTKQVSSKQVPKKSAPVAKGFTLQEGEDSSSEEDDESSDSHMETETEPPKKIAIPNVPKQNNKPVSDLLQPERQVKQKVKPPAEKERVVEKRDDDVVQKKDPQELKRDSQTSSSSSSSSDDDSVSSSSSGSSSSSDSSSSSGSS